MKVKLTRDTSVRMDEGKIVEVSEEEAKRLIAFKLAVEVPQKKK